VKEKGERRKKGWRRGQSINLRFDSCAANLDVSILPFPSSVGLNELKGGGRGGEREGERGKEVERLTSASEVSDSLTV